MLIILVIQTGILYGINSYFHVDDVTVAYSSPVAKPVANVELSEDKGTVNLVGTSYDKSYYSIAYSKHLSIYPTKEKKPIFEMDVPAGMYVSVMHWLPDENRLLYAIANSSKTRTGRIEVHVVNVASKQDSLVKELSGLSEGSHVKAFALSTFTNLLYVDVENSRKSDSIYKINIMEHMNRISLASYKIDNVAVASKEELFFYEDTIRRQVFSYNGRRIKMITPDDWDYCLLGISKEDELYIGRLNDGKVTSIFKSDKDGKMTLFADLAHEVPRENFILGLNGQLVVKNFPTEKYIAVIKPNGETKTFDVVSPDAFITGDAMFYIQDGKMHITYFQ